MYKMMHIFIIAITLTNTVHAASQVCTVARPTTQSSSTVTVQPRPATHQELLALPASYWEHKQATSPYFNGKKLAEADVMRERLITQEGFKLVDVTATDGVKLKGLLRLCPNAPYTVVSFSGFIPGIKEGMATLIELLPSNVNILLVEARGHGQSEGRFISLLGDYGLTEHFDVMGSLAYTHEVTQNSPIIVHGFCMGGYNDPIKLDNHT
jgi:hypothetical protein